MRSRIVVTVCGAVTPTNLNCRLCSQTPSCATGRWKRLALPIAEQRIYRRGNRRGQGTQHQCRLGRGRTNKPASGSAALRDVADAMSNGLKSSVSAHRSCWRQPMPPAAKNSRSPLPAASAASGSAANPAGVTRRCDAAGAGADGEPIPTSRLANGSVPTSGRVHRQSASMRRTDH